MPMTNDIAELEELEQALGARLKKLRNDAQAVSGRAEAGQRDMTAAEQAKVDALFSEFNATEIELKSVRAEIEEARGSVSRGRVVPPMMGGRQDEQIELRTGPQNFAQLFPGAPNGRSANGGFANIGEFARAVKDRDPRLFQNASGMQTGVAVDGGFYIPPGFLAGLVDGSLQAESIRPRATVVPVTGSSVSIPLFDTTDRSTKIAGLEGKPTGEGAAGTPQKAVLNSLLLKPVKQVVLVPTTEELISDAPGIFGTLLQKYMVEAISAKNDYVFLNGTGAGESMGIITAPCTVVVSKEAGQAAATLLPENLAKMVSRLAPGAFAKAVWLASSTILPQLFLLSVKVKNVAATENVGGFGPNWFSVSVDGSMQLFGRPLVITDRCPALGTKGDIVLGDLTAYLIGLRQDATLAVDNSIGFKEGEVWFKVTMRVDGQPMLKSAITPRLGGSTLSPFVVIETR